MKKNVYRILAFFVLTLSIVLIFLTIDRNLVDSDDQAFDKNSFILQDVDKDTVERIAEHYDATYYISEDSGTAVIYLKEDISVEGVFEDAFFKQYKNNATKNYYATLFGAEEYYSTPETTLNTQQYAQQEYLNYINLTDVASHTTNYTSKVVIIDTGIDYDHPDLKAAISSDSYNVDLQQKVNGRDYSIIDDEYGHGTNIAGIISGSNNILGINPNVELVVIKITPKFINGKLSVNTDQLIKALEYVATLDVDVINMSWGVYSSSNPFEKQIQKIVDKGAICVASAGNDKTSTISYPAADDNVIAVGAYDYETNQLADYSNYGSDIDVVAPGKVFTTDLNGGYKSAVGTSYSSAIVAAAFSHLETWLTKDLLYSSCYDLGEKGKDFFYGNGLIDVSKLVYGKKSNVSFNMLCEEIESYSMQYIDGGVLQYFPTPEKRVYDYFEGWYYDENLTRKVNYYYDSFSGFVTLYAKWVSNSYSGELLFTYQEVESNQIEITGYTGNRNKIAIPTTIKNMNVVGIGDCAFINSKFKEVELPTTLKYIGASAFAGSSLLKEINIPDSVKLIDNSAFSDCSSLKNVNISENSNLEEILKNAFYNTNIESFYIPSKVFRVDELALASNSINYINVNKNNLSYTSSDGVLYNKAMTSLLYYPSGKTGSFVVSNKTKTISSYAFYRSNLGTIDLNNVEDIWPYAFNYATISNIDISSNIKEIKESTFAFSTIGKITFAEGVTTIPEFAFENATITSISLPKSVQIIKGGSFYFATIDEFMIPTDSNLTSILNTRRITTICGAFEGSSISTFVAPRSLTYIASKSFMNCRSLSVVDLSKSQLTSILSDTFKNSGLTQVSLPETLNSIGEDAFAYCKLTSFHIGEKVEQIGAGFLTGNPIASLTFNGQNLHYIVEDNTLYSKDKTILHSSFTSGYYFLAPAMVEVVNDKAFKDNKNIEYFEMSQSVISHIGNEAFKNSSIHDVAFGANINSLGDEAFANCSNLTRVSFDANCDLDAISNYAFAGSSNIRSIVIPNSVKIIGEGAFANCNLKSLVLGSSVKSVGSRAFARNDITQLTLNEGLEIIGIEAFGSNSISNLNIPSTVITIYENAFEGSTIKTLTFEENSQIVEIRDFGLGKLNLEELTIPASLQSIGKEVFSGVSKITFEENSELIQLNSSSIKGVNEIYFENNSSLTSIVGSLNENQKLLVLDLKGTKLEKIDDLSFSNCKNLQTVNLPNTIKEIGSYAFLNCEKLNSIVIPSSIEIIEDFAFYGCSISVYFEGETLSTKLSTYWDIGVSEYFFGVSNIYEDGDFTFMESGSGKTLVKYNGASKSVDLSTLNIDFIGSESFSGSNIETIILPSMLKGINSNAFSYSTIKEIFIPNSVKYIDSYAFYNSNISNVIFSTDSSIEKIAKFAFANCYMLNSIDIPNSVHYIESYAFYHSNLTYINFTEDSLLTEISDYSFAYTKLVSIDIPSNVTKIGIGAFTESSLTNVNFNHKELTISERAFYMADLLEVFIPYNVIYIGEYAFSGNVNLSKFEVDLNNQNYSSYESALYNKNKTVLICFPASITGKYDLPSFVEDISKGAFEYSQLSELNFANNNALYIINTRAFFNAKNLERIVIPSSVVYIDYYAFAYCDNLKEVVIEDGSSLKGIYEGAFYYCKSLETINVPESISQISDYAFYGTVNLKTFDFTYIEEINSYAFAYSGIEIVDLSNSNLIYLGANAFAYSKIKAFINDSSLRDSLIIESGILTGCQELEEISIYFYDDKPISYYFGGQTYYDNPNFVPKSLKSLTLNGSLTKLPEGAFYMLSMLENIELPEECKVIGQYALTEVVANFKLPNDVAFENGFISLSGNVQMDKLIIGDEITAVHLNGVTGIKEIDFVNQNVNFSISATNLEIIRFSSPYYANYINLIDAKGATFIFDCDLPQYINHYNFDIIYNPVLNNNYMYLKDGEYKHLDTIYYNDSFRSVNKNVRLENMYINSSITEFNTSNMPTNVKNIYYDGTLQNWLDISFQSSSYNPLRLGANFYYKNDSNEWVLCENLVIPDFVTHINDNQFVGLIAETIDFNNVISIGKQAFYRSKIGTIDFHNVISIDKQAFYGSKIGTIDFNNVVSIGEEAFAYCDTRVISISEKVEVIDSHAFIYSVAPVLNIYLKEEYELSNLFANSKINTINVTGGEIHRDAFSIYENFEIITISPSVTLIDSYFAGIVDVLDFLGTVEQWLMIDFGDFYSVNGVNVLINGEELKEVVIPNTITNIQNKKFNGMSKLEKVIMSDSVESIGSSAFSDCPALKEVVFSKNLKTIESNAFAGCTSLTSVKLSDKVVSIDAAAFYNCYSLSEIVMPNGLEYIGNAAFNGCYALKEIVIPETVTSIGTNLFGRESKLEKLSIPFVDIELYKYFDSSDQYFKIKYLKEIIITNDTHLPYGAFSALYDVDKITVTNKITEFSNTFNSAPGLDVIQYQGTVYELLNCNGINPSPWGRPVILTNDEDVNLVIDESTPEIGTKLNGNLSITTLTILSNNINIDQSLMNCDNLKTLVLLNSSIYVPEHIKNIVEEVVVLEGNTIFSNSFDYEYWNLRKITVPESVKTFEFCAFAGCTQLEEINIPSSLQYIGDAAFENCYSLKEITLPEGLTYIGGNAFRNCYSLKEVNIPTSVDTIGTAAFSSCTSLKEIKIPYIENISTYLFAGCTSLTNVYLDNDFKTISSSMFEYCSSLQYIEMNGVESIDSYAFGGCTLLKEITLPKTITYISNASFSEGLEKVIFENGFNYVYAASVGGYTPFMNISTLKEAVIPASLASTNAYLGDFETVYFTGSIEEFNNSAATFLNIKYLYIDDELVTNLILPEGIETIYNDYENLVDLETVTVPSSVKNISSQAFSNCINLHTIYNNTNNDDISAIIRNSYVGKIIYSDGSYYGESYELILDGFVFYFDYLDDPTPRLIRYDGNKTSAELPETINGKTYSIYKFNNKNLVEIIVPATVLIKSDSFVGSDLLRITIYNFNDLQYLNPLKGTIEELTFINIDRMTFKLEGFVKLKEVSFIDCNQLVTFEYDCFKDCVSLESVILPNSLQNISGSFNNCISLKTLDLPNSLQNISGSFNNCISLKTLDLPNSLQNISGSFDNCISLKTIKIPFNVVNISNSFNNCSLLENIELPGALTTISGFSGCTSLVSITIPSNVTSLSGFNNCTSLKEIILSEGITDVGSFRYLASGCTSFERLVLPSTYCGTADLAYSVSSYDLYYGGTVYDWCQLEFETPTYSYAYVAKDIYFKNENDEWYLVEDLIIPSEVSVVHSYAFAFFKNVKSISFTSSTFFEKDVIYRDYQRLNPQIESMYFYGSNDDFVNIVLNSFDSNVSSYLKDIYINDKLYTDLIIPNGVTNINSDFFRGIDCINYLYIPESLVSVSQYGLYLPELTVVDYGGTVEEFAQIEFADTYNYTPMSISNNLYIKGVLLEDLSINLESYNLVNFRYVLSIKTISNLGGITEIPNLFMEGNSNLETIIISDSVTKIGRGAFENCNNLKNVIIGPHSQLEIIEERAFLDCGHIDYFSIPSSLQEYYFYPYKYDIQLEIGKLNYYGTIQQWMNINFVTDSALAFCLKFDEFYLNGEQVDTVIFDNTITEQSSKNLLDKIDTIKTIILDKEMLDWSSIAVFSTTEKIYYNGTLEEWILSPYNGSLLSDSIEFYYLNELGKYEKMTRHLKIPSSISTFSKPNMFGKMTFDSISYHKDQSYQTEFTNYYNLAHIKNVYFTGNLQEFLNSDITPQISSNHIKLYLNGKLINKITINENDDVSAFKLLSRYDIKLLVNNSDAPISIYNAREYGFGNLCVLSDKDGSYGKNNGDYYQLKEENGFYYRVYSESEYALFYIDTESDEITLPVNAFGKAYSIYSLEFNDFEKIIIPEGYNFEISCILPTRTLEFNQNIKEIKNIDCLDYEYIILPETIDLIKDSFNVVIAQEHVDDLLSKTKVVENSFNDINIGKLRIYGNVEEIYHSFNSDISELIFEEGIKIISYSFNNMGIKTLHIPSSINKLEYSFINGYDLEQLTFSETINAEIIEASFGSLDKINNLVLPEGVQSIKDCFGYCSSLTTLKVPSTVNRIENSFDDCTLLTDIIFESLECTVNAFENCHSIAKIDAKGNYDWNIDLADTVLAKNKENYIDGGLYIYNTLVLVDADSKYLRIKEGSIIDIQKSYDIAFLEVDYLSGDLLAKLPWKIETIKINKMTPGLNLNSYLYRTTAENIIIGKDVSYLGNRWTFEQKLFFEHEKLVVDLWNLNFEQAFYNGEWIIVTFENDGQVISKAPQSKYQIIRIPYYVPANDEYTNRWLNGWDYNNDGIVDPVPAISTEDVTFKAIIGSTQAKYYVTYFDNDGITPIYVDEYNYGDILQIREAISKKGYTFDGWDYSLADNIITGNVIIYSKWTHIGEHDYSLIEVIEPTCSERGYTKHTCIICDEYYLDKFEERINHEMSSIVIDASCEENGYTLYSCANCSYHYEAEHTDKIPHNFTEFEIIYEATCEENGRMKHQCLSCGYVEYQTIEMFGHDIVEYIENEATCYHRGQIFYSCNRCEYTEEYLTDYLSHNYIEVVVTNDIIEELKNNNVVIYEYLDHYSSYICENCNQYQSKTIKLEGFFLQSTCAHTESNEVTVVDANCLTFGLIKTICLTCEETTSYKRVNKKDCSIQHLVIEPTCMAGGYTIIKCDYCDTIYDYVDYVEPLGHKYNFNYQWIENECIITLTCGYDASHTISGAMQVASKIAVEPTCEETGILQYTAIYVYDGKTYTSIKEEVIDALGHKEIIDAKIEPSCTSTGLTEGKHCDTCKEVFVAQEVLAKLPHEYVDTTIEPTCENQGYTHHVCTCGEQYNDLFVEALGHNEIVDVGIDPTCTSTGLTEGKHCDTCKEVFVAQEVLAKLPHEYVDTTIEPTCENQGYTHHLCTCGEQYNDLFVEALGHEKYIYEVINSTCTEEGYTVLKCNRCSTFSEIIDKTEPKGHDFVVSYSWQNVEYCFGLLTCERDANHTSTLYMTITSEVIVEAACEVQGLIKYTASKEYQGILYTTTKEVYVEALEHSIVMDLKIEATCKETGYTEGKHCEKCGKIFIAQEKIPMIDHDFNHVVVDPTCESDGYTTHKCKYCGTMYKDSIMEKLGHKDSEWIIDCEATYKQDGHKYTECENCGKITKEETIKRKNIAIPIAGSIVVVGLLLAVILFIFRKKKTA